MFGFGDPSFNPDKDIPDLSGRVFLVTGGNIGLGKETIYQISKHNPSQIYLGARTESKARDAIADIKKEVPDAKVTFLPLDLSSFASIKSAADQFKQQSQQLHVLVNNAGIMACPPGKTQEGYETQFGTNHVGHALLTKLLLPTMQKTAQENEAADVRIVNLSSEGHRFAPSGGLLLKDCKSEMTGINTWTRYGQSKLANVLFTAELAKRYPNIKSVVLHPGSVQTNLVSGPMASYASFASVIKTIAPYLTVSVQKGALNQIWASTGKDVKTGKFYYPVKKENPGSANAQSEKLARELWDWTEKELAENGYAGWP